ncbi:MAG: hypothetical protein Q9201_001258 [Fulgogasparrea decipioides]
MAYMFDQQRRGATPFGFAVFFSPIFIACPDDSYCEQLIMRLLDDNHTAFRSSFPDGDLVPLLGLSASTAERTFVEYLQIVLSMHSMVGRILPNTCLDFFGEGKAEVIPRLLHPLLTEDRIQIPTVHVTGSKDVPSMVEQSWVAQRLCNASLVRVHSHMGGHEVPFKKSDVKAVVSSVRMAVEEAYE